MLCIFLWENKHLLLFTTFTSLISPFVPLLPLIEIKNSKRKGKFYWKSLDQNCNRFTMIGKLRLVIDWINGNKRNFTFSLSPFHSFVRSFDVDWICWYALWNGNESNKYWFRSICSLRSSQRDTNLSTRFKEHLFYREYFINID